MKAGWKTVKLNDVCDIVKGRKPNLRATPNKGDLPYLVARHIRGLENPEYGSPDEKGVVTLTEDDTVIICDGSNSGEIFTGLNGIMSSTMGKVVKKTEIHDPYLRHFLASTFELFNGTKTGSAIPHLDKEAFRKLDIPLPPLAEQKRIVALLDEAFAGIDEAKAKAQRNGINVRSIFESHLTSTFAHRATLLSLSSFADEITDGDHAPPPKAQSGIPFITISDIDKRTGFINFRDTFKVPEDYYHGLKPNKKPRVGDILYTVTGATLGIPVMVRDKVKFCFQRHIGLIRPNATSDSRWLTYALRSPQAYKQACLGSTGAAQKTVSLRVLRNLRLPEASPSEQKEVAAKLNNIENQIFHLEKLMEKKTRVLDEMKLSILAQAFAGELTA